MRMQQRFAQISDPHLSTLEGVSAGDLLNKRLLGYLSWRRKRRHEHRGEVLEALQRDLQAEDFEQLLVTGDLTHIGLPDEFRQARDWLQQLGPATRVALIPGNHDACVPSDWQQTFALWCDYMASDPQASTPSTPVEQGELFPSLRVRGDIAFIGLSTACPTPPLMASGSLGRDQLEKLASLLESTAQRGLFRVVYLHHCPLPGLEKWRKRLTDAQDLQSLMQRHGAELILHGHGHRAHHRELETSQGPVPVIAIPSASALGLHGADVAAYNRYRVERSPEGWNLDIEGRRYQSDKNSFVADKVRRVELRRPWRQPSPGSL
jgi:3',5'-cyclic AMP phosphodiesterase CpdA